MALTFAGVVDEHGAFSNQPQHASVALAASGAPPAGVPSEISSPLPGAEVELWRSVLVLLWLVGAGWFGCRLGGGWWQLRKLRLESRPVDDPVLLQRFDYARRRVGVSREVMLRVGENLKSPLTVGWWQPVVVVPASLIFGMPPNHWDAIFAHELMHVRRWDFLVNLFLVSMRSALFLSPGGRVAGAAVADGTRGGLRSSGDPHDRIRFEISVRVGSAGSG